MSEEDSQLFIAEQQIGNEELHLLFILAAMVNTCSPIDLLAFPEVFNELCNIFLAR